MTFKNDPYKLINIDFHAYDTSVHIPMYEETIAKHKVTWVKANPDVE